MKSPNIVILISHDTGRYLRSYGYKIDTPSLDQLVKDGVQFNEYYCPAPQCSPSRGSLLTGKYPHNNGLIGLGHKGFSIYEDIKTLPMALNEAGYDTTLIGFSHETIGKEEPGKSSSTTRLGYQNYVHVEGNFAPEVTNEAIKFFEEKRHSETPFFVNIGFEETHRPFERYEPYMDKLEDIEVLPYLPDTLNVRRDLSLFHGSVKVLDEAIGRITKTLKETRLDENTIVIYTTDHGLAFPRAKGTLKDAGIETALIIRVPYVDVQGRKLNHLLCNVDLMPTILDLVGAEIPEGIDGKSFAKLLLGKSEDEVREEFFCEMTWHDQYHPMRGVRTKEFKFIKNFHNGPKIYMPYDIHSSLSGVDVRDQFYVDAQKEEIYDLKNDPLEERNLIDDEEYELVANQLRQRLEEWMVRTNDPILFGKVEGKPSSSWAIEEEAGRTYIRKD